MQKLYAIMNVEEEVLIIEFKLFCLIDCLMFENLHTLFSDRAFKIVDLF